MGVGLTNAIPSIVIGVPKAAAEKSARPVEVGFCL